MTIALIISDSIFHVIGGTYRLSKPAKKQETFESRRTDFFGRRQRKYVPSLRTDISFTDNLKTGDVYTQAGIFPCFQICLHCILLLTGSYCIFSFNDPNQWNSYEWRNKTT